MTALSPIPIREEDLLAALRGVPSERWPEVLRYLTSLQPVSPQTPIRTAEEVAASPIVGLWKDRTDIGSSEEFARALRREAELRSGSIHAP